MDRVVRSPKVDPPQGAPAPIFGGSWPPRCKRGAPCGAQRREPCGGSLCGAAAPVATDRRWTGSRGVQKSTPHRTPPCQFSVDRAPLGANEGPHAVLSGGSPVGGRFVAPSHPPTVSGGGQGRAATKSRPPTGLPRANFRWIVPLLVQTRGPMRCPAGGGLWGVALWHRRTHRHCPEVDRVARRPKVDPPQGAPASIFGGSCPPRCKRGVPFGAQRGGPCGGSFCDVVVPADTVRRWTGSCGDQKSTPHRAPPCQFSVDRAPLGANEGPHAVPSGGSPVGGRFVAPSHPPPLEALSKHLFFFFLSV